MSFSVTSGCATKIRSLFYFDYLIPKKFYSLRKTYKLMNTAATTSLLRECYQTRASSQFSLLKQLSLYVFVKGIVEYPFKTILQCSDFNGFRCHRCIKNTNISKIWVCLPHNITINISNNERYQSKDDNNYRKYNRWKSVNYMERSPLLALFVPVLCSMSHHERCSTEREFLLAAMVGNLEKLQELLDKGTDVNCRHPYGWTSLQAAAMNGRSKAVAFLLKNGADPNLPDHFSNIRLVARQNNKSFIQVEQIRESEFSARLKHDRMFRGCTALHYAMLADDQDSIKHLLEAGGSPNLANDYDHKPADYARDIGMKKLMEHHCKKYEEKEKKSEMEERRKFPIEQRIKSRIIGQNGAIAVVCGAIRRKENGWYDEEHPLVFLFLGSSGIGKTELAKQVAEYLHKGDSKGFIRMDMSEYQQKHEVAKFIGSPPGYIGHDDGGQLTKQLRKNPRAVVLFDEVEKAHPDVLTILLQLFDEGRLTDGKGITIECKDAIFIMTSNLASEEIADHAMQLRAEAEKIVEQRYGGKEVKDLEQNETVEISRRFKEKIIRPILKNHFQRDEFLGRINEIIYFVPFTQPELLQLVRVELERWVKQAHTKHNIEIKWDPTVLDVLADGYNIYYGARSIRHEVERRVVTQLALAYESGQMKEGATVWISTENTNPNVQSIKIKVKQKSDEKYTEIDPDMYLKQSGPSNP